MKKTNIFKIVMTLVLAFVITGASAQILGVGEATDYEDATTVPVISYMTEGTTMPLWVMPDDLYQPGYDPETDDATATGHTWTWTPDAGIALGSDDGDNYVTITPAVTGTQTDYTVNVKENLPSSMGGCGDPTGTDITIRSVLAPAINDFNTFETVFGITSGGAAYEYCGNQTGATDIDISINGFAAFQVDWSVAIEEIDGTGATVVGNTNNGVLIDYTAATGTPQEFLSGSNSLTRSEPSADLILESRTFIMIKDEADGTTDRRTKYTYTINGITDNISRKSDYLGATTWYDNGGYVFTVIVNPAPVTGPIYHIPNDFGNL